MLLVGKVSSEMLGKKVGWWGMGAVGRQEALGLGFGGYCVGVAVVVIMSIVVVVNVIAIVNRAIWLASGMVWGFVGCH